MEIDGSTYGIITHPPTKNEIYDYQLILLSDEFDWDPSNNLFKISSMEEEYRTSSNVHRYINIVDSRIPSAPPTTQCRNDLEINEFDIAMENFSIGIAQDLMVDRIIKNVMVSRTRSRYTTYTDNRNHGIRADLLVRKLGIGLDKVNDNLQSTTQDNTR